MFTLIIMGVGLVIGLSFLAYTLAIYAVPFMLGLTAARFAYATGSGFIGAGLVGIVAGVAVFCGLVFLFMVLRHPIQRLAIALIFAGPAAVAGYELVYGITRESVPSEIWRQFFCIVGGVFVGMSALARLIGSPEMPVRR
jgi:hypothetical protein